MKVVLVDNGSLEPSAHRGLRAVAAAIGRRAGVPVDAVSWKHSDRIPAVALDGVPAWTLEAWVTAQVSAGERDFLFVPFFISPQGAIGSSLRSDITGLQEKTGGFEFSFTDGLAESDALAAIVADRIRTAVTERQLDRPAVVVVDHGGPSPASAWVRNSVANAVRTELGDSIARLTAASMESPDGPGFDFNRPLFIDAVREPGPGDVLVAPLFLLPGRHAGPSGDLRRIALEAQEAAPGLRCHFSDLVGNHPAVVETLGAAVTKALGALTLS
jgi:sirohydrochlorin ferrochelatase